VQDRSVHGYIIRGEKSHRTDIRPLAKVIFATENTEKKERFSKVSVDSVAEQETLMQEVY
jgi:hypothetical protein